MSCKKQKWLIVILIWRFKHKNAFIAIKISINAKKCLIKVVYFESMEQETNF